MTRPQAWIAVGLAGAALLAGCGETHLSFLDPQGPVATQQRTHFLLILGLVAIVVVPVLVITPLLVWRFGYGRKATYTPRWDFSRGLEWVIWGVPVVVATTLAVLLWTNTTDLDPWDPLASAEPPRRIQVVGYDWKWLFIYPEQGIATINELAFPADRQIALQLTSETVMQSFMIPALGGQIYAMGAGMVTRLHLAANGTGTFRGENTQYNGQGFHEQKFDAHALSSADFEAWVDDVRRTGIAFDPRARTVLEARNTARTAARMLGATDGPPFGAVRFAPVPQGIFEDIVGRVREAAGKDVAGMGGRTR